MQVTPSTLIFALHPVYVQIHKPWWTYLIPFVSLNGEGGFLQQAIMILDFKSEILFEESLRMHATNH